MLLIPPTHQRRGTTMRLTVTRYLDMYNIASNQFNLESSLFYLGILSDHYLDTVSYRLTVYFIRKTYTLAHLAI